ncbi:hypothetical protein M409DRAFT_21683 [Zasmidium cellare ATCC 36951]|uniref:Uncharacterized protein n=1 Tax=Zasmidium cellare ATCC 36951 TaxID=1080233 RepID=A0A6A6CM68_ZASCE|nr:uncharacterized protein M409DRAFT_21683 [Zasmidium cellare ATCC 36951]KAF2168245.1 hypothetical protein M409DRAFT_21683 [Zasmidium cellare ATCC 36951]
MDRSPLNKLPAELRDLIYHFALVRNCPIVLYISKREHKVRIRKESEKKHVMGLSSTCKQIRTESLPIFYKGNHFKIAPTENQLLESPESSVTPILAWKMRLGASISCLRFLEIGVNGNALNVGLVEEEDENFSKAFIKLRDEFNMPRLQLTLTLTGHDFLYYDKAFPNRHCLSFSIVDGNVGQALQQYEQDLKKLEENALSEYLGGEPPFWLDAFDAMKTGLAHIAKRLQEKA